MMEEQLASRVAAIIVSYEPDPALLQQNIEAIQHQVSCIYLVDNSIVFDAAAFVQALQSQKIHCLTLGNNYGIATAINRGIAEAERASMDFVFLLDQDSVCKPGLITVLLRAYDQALRLEKPVAAIGARAEDRVTGALSPALRFGWFSTRAQSCPVGSVVGVDFLISSGTLIPLATLQVVGGMREDLFIDHVDTEWILRAHSKGYASYLCCDAHIWHAIGERRMRIWMGRWRNAPLHRPFRYYYLFRNYLLLLRQRELSRKWKVMEGIRLIQMAVFLLIFSEGRKKILGYIMQGIRDGLQNRGGRLDG